MAGIMRPISNNVIPIEVSTEPDQLTEISTVVQPQQTPGGIMEIPDTLETFNALDHFTTSQKTSQPGGEVLLSGTGQPDGAAGAGASGQPDEGIGAVLAHPWDSLASPQSVIEEIVHPPGQVSTDTINFLFEEMGKSDPDEVAMLDAIANLSPADREATLDKLQNHGPSKDSDLQRVLRTIYQNPAALAKMGDLLTMLAGDVWRSPDDIQFRIVMMTMFSNLPPDGGDAVVRDFLSQNAGHLKQTLEPLYGPEVASMEKLLTNSAPSLQNIFSSELLRKAVQRIIDEDHVEYITQFPDLKTSLDNYLNTYLSGTDSQLVSDSHVAEALTEFPEMGNQFLLDLNSNGKLDAFITKMLGSNEKIGPILGEMCQRIGSSTQLTDVMSKIVAVLQRDGGNLADDNIRNFVASLGSNSVDLLSKLPVSLLQNIEAILNDGDDQQLDLEIKNKILKPAMQKAAH